MPSFPHSFLPSFISFLHLHSFLHSFLPSLFHSFIPSLLPSFLPSFLLSFIYVIHSFIRDEYRYRISLKMKQSTEFYAGFSGCICKAFMQMMGAEIYRWIIPNDPSFCCFMLLHKPDRYILTINLYGYTWTTG